MDLDKPRGRIMKTDTFLIVCSGSMSGSADFYQRLVELMLNLTEREDCYGESSDQPILTFPVWSGRVKDAGIRYRFLGCDRGLMTLRWCVVNQLVRFNESVQVMSPPLSISTSGSAG
jgi:hypothetical protein